MAATDRPDYHHCLDVFARLYEYLDRALTAEEEAWVRDHLAICESCLRHFEFEQELLDRVRAAARSVQAPQCLREAVSKLLGALE